MIILTEKPSVAKDIAKGLGGFTPVNGVWIREKKDCICSARGHLLELFEPEDYDSMWAGPWKDSISQLPIMPQSFKYKPNPNVLDVLSQIKDIFNTYDNSEFILATDAEREGEVIGAEILDYVGFKNYDTAKRFWVSEALTPEVVKKGIASAKPLLNYSSYKDAGFARARADWLIGMNFTRLISVSTNTLCSFGRVQTAVLGAIYLRDFGIKNFVSKNYYQLTVKVSKGNNIFTMYYNERRSALEDKFENTVNLNQIKNQLKDKIRIDDIQTEKKTELQPQLFNITGLQKYCSNKYHLTPAETLDAAQILYEKLKCMSYPRTPSTVLGNDNVELFRDKFEKLSAAYPELAAGTNIQYISDTNKRIFNSAKLQDHHALIPLAPIDEEAATQAQKNVYQAVLERFFQTIKEPYIYNSITVYGTDEKNNLFISHGKNILQSGWKDGAQACAPDEDQEETIPDLTTGELLDIQSSEILEKQTKPKKHFTNATILGLMENPKNENPDEKNGKLSGLGTPATRADIIKTLIEREYVQQKGQQLCITEKGTFLIETVIKIPSLANFISIKTTTDWEQQLQDQPEIFLNNIISFVNKEIPQIEIKEKWVGGNLGNCPLCKKGHIFPGKNNYYCSAYKEGCKAVIWKNICGATISDADLKLLLCGKSTKTKKMKSKEGKQFQAAIKLTISNNEIKTVFDFKK